MSEPEIPHDMEQWQPKWKPNVTVFRTGNKVPLTTYTDEFGWRCHKCGWVGLGHYAPTICRDEGVRHKCPPEDD